MTHPKNTVSETQVPNPAARRPRATPPPQLDALLRRLRILGIVLVVAGIPVAGAALGYGAPTAFQGLASAQEMYEAQGVTLRYDDRGQLTHSGSAEVARDVLTRLEQEWQYPVNHANLDANDPLVNTRDELMFQYAAITTDILTRPVQVTLEAEHVPITYRGVTYTEPGTYPIAVGASYAELDRDHPIESQLRGAWSAMPLTLMASLAGGHANQAAGELAAMVSLGIGGIGLLFSAAGAGLIWISLATGRTAAPARLPDTARAPTRSRARASFTTPPARPVPQMQRPGRPAASSSSW